MCSCRQCAAARPDLPERGLPLLLETGERRRDARSVVDDHFAVLTDRQLAARYRGPDRAGQTSHWLRANMVASLDGAATVRGRTGGLSGGADPRRDGAAVAF